MIFNKLLLICVCGPVQDVSRQKTEMLTWLMETSGQCQDKVDLSLFSPLRCSPVHSSISTVIYLYPFKYFDLVQDMLTCQMETECPKCQDRHLPSLVTSSLLLENICNARRGRCHLILQISWKAAEERHTLNRSQTYTMDLVPESIYILYIPSYMTASQYKGKYLCGAS